MVRALASLRSELHSKMLAIRNLCRLLESESFIATYESSPDKEQLSVLIENLDQESLERWLKSQVVDLEAHPVKRLRELCVQLAISGYRYMTKLQLIAAIKAKRHEQSTRTPDRNEGPDDRERGPSGEVRSDICQVGLAGVA